MFRWMLVLGGACMALAACADGAPIPTGAAAGPVRISAVGTVALSQGEATVTLPAAASLEMRRGTSLSSVIESRWRGVGGGDRVERAALPLVGVRADARGLMAPKDSYRRVVTFRDESGNTHHLVALYDDDGGPPRAIQHYLGNELYRVTAMKWERRSGVWMQRRLLAREIRDGSLLLQADARAGELQVAERPASPLGARVLALLAAGIAHTFAPSEARAQYYFRECWDAYSDYVSATATLTATIIALELAAESGVGGAALFALRFAYVAALARACTAEMGLFICVDNARERERVQNDDHDGSYRPTGGGRKSRSQSKADCLEGSYAAHCQTAFAL